jgi:carboxypeptidase family protein
MPAVRTPAGRLPRRAGSSGRAAVLVLVGALLLGGVLVAIFRGGGGEIRTSTSSAPSSRQESAPPTPPVPAPPAPARAPAGTVTIAGHLVTEAGLPFERPALVRAVEREGEARFESSSSGGSVALEVTRGIGALRFEVEADFAGYWRDDWFHLDDPEVEAGVRLVLEAAGNVEGTIRSPGRELFESGRVVLASVPSGATFTRRLSNEGAGRFTLRGVRPGRYTAVAQVRGLGVSSPSEVAVRANETSTLDLFLSGDSFIAGRVEDPEGRGIAGADVVAYASGKHGDSTTWALGPFHTKTGADGSFRLDSLRPGEWDVVASKEGMRGRGSEDGTVTVPAAGGVEKILRVLEAGRSVQGRVLDRNGAPLSGAQVIAQDDWWSPKANRRFDRPTRFSRQAGKTDEEGRFHLTGLCEGPSVVEARLEGHGVAEARDIEPDTTDLVLTLPGPTGIGGRVIEEETGSPIRRFTVRVLGVSTPRASLSGGIPERRVVAADGSFEILDLREGAYALGFEARGFAPRKLEGVEVKAGEIRRDLEVRMRRSSTIRGVVVERDTGEPIDGAGIAVESLAKNDWLDLSCLTDERGRFEVEGLEAGSFRLLAHRDGFVSTSVGPVEVPKAGLVEGILISLSRGGAVEGTALRPGAVSFEGGTALARPLDESRQQKDVPIGPEGRFRIEGLASGKWTIVATRRARAGEDWRGPWAEALRAVAVVEEGRTTEVDFGVLVAGCRVRIRVHRGEEPIARARVRLQASGPPSDAWALALGEIEGETGEDGSALFEKVPPGAAYLRVSPGAESAETRHSIAVPEAGEKDFDVSLTGGEILGRVHEREGGAPVQAIQVRAESVEDASAGTRLEAEWNAETDAEGRFRVRDLPAGSYWVIAGRLPGAFYSPKGKADDLFAPPVGPIEVGEGAAVNVEIPVVRGGRARVVVLDSDGAPLEGVPVHIRSSGGEAPPIFRWGQGATTDGRGIARVGGIVPGLHYYASAQARGFGECMSEEREIRSGEETEFRVVRRAATRVRIALVGEDGAPAAWPTLRLLDGKGRELLWWSVRAENREPGEEGKGVVLLAPGEYTILLGEKAFPILVGERGPQEVVFRVGS